MKTLYVSQQGCYLALRQESLLVKHRDEILQSVQLPLLEQVLVFGKSQITTQAIRACLWRDIPIAYLSQMGFCYGRIVAIERGYRQLARYQQSLSRIERLIVARTIVEAKLKNSRTLLMRQYRKHKTDNLNKAIQRLSHFAEQAINAEAEESLLGIEGAGAASYFEGFSDCLRHSDFQFMGRSRRPPGNPVNAMLSFGYQVVWNHLLSLIEIQGLDPYHGCLHHGSARHAALASDLIEEFRAAIIDSLVLQLVNNRMVDASKNFENRDGGCFLNESGRQIFLKAFLQRMEQTLKTEESIDEPRWNTLNHQVKAFKRFVYDPSTGYKPYLIR